MRQLEYSPGFKIYADREKKFLRKIRKENKVAEKLQRKLVSARSSVIENGELAKMIIAAEWGYRQCEKGKNLQATLAELQDLLTMPFDELKKQYLQKVDGLQ